VVFLKKINLKKTWNVICREYQKKHKISTNYIHYGTNVPPERKLKLLGNLKGKDFLEVGCGGGQCSIAAAKRGAVATGIDISDEQIKFAKELAKKNKVNVKFYRGNIENLNKIKSNSQDIVFSAHALQYVKNLKKCFKEVYRVLKKNGIFVFSLGHPIYRIFNDDPKLKVHLSYFDTGYHEFVWSYKGTKLREKCFVIFRKIDDLFNTLVESGFKVEKMLEPKLLKKDVIADYSEFYPYKMLKMVPSTIIFKAKK